MGRRPTASWTRRTLPAVLCTVLAACGTSGAQEQEPDAVPVVRDQEITTRAVAAAALEHLDGTEVGTALGTTDVSESQNEKLHLVTWMLGEGNDLIVAVSRNDPSEGPAPVITCAGLQEDGSRLRSCEERDSGGTPVVVFASGEDMTGGRYGDDGVMWGAIAEREGGVVLATESLSRLEQEGWREGRDLPVPTDALAAIAADPDLDLETSQAVIDAGEALEDYRGRE